MEFIFKTKRLNWDVYALKIAEVAALRSEDPWRKVGACALDYNNRVIGVAYNGLAPGKKAPKNFWKDRDQRLPYMIHAEANLLSLFERGKCKTLATTLLPCKSCATLIAGHGIKKVVYKEMYDRDKSALDIFKFYSIECIEINEKFLNKNI
jgi:dCMP deaminase